ncbi:MAG: PD-(D/E)XK nuclease family protein, partial [Gammaproteobacteria bacterium]|nr:PD-(D/E)XK nuclease family protein [Gammaproteobacteria bacterium]
IIELDNTHSFDNTHSLTNADNIVEADNTKSLANPDNIIELDKTNFLANSNSNNIIGIAFAEIHPDQLSFKGISKTEIEIPAIIPISKVEYANQRNWEEQRQEWQKHLNTLSNDFYQGIASVNPKHQDTCQYCQLQSFCRIYEKKEEIYE